MVTVVDVARGVSRPLTTDSAGLYAAPDLTPGTYTVRAEFMGFKTIERQNVMLDAGGDVRVDLQLQPGEQNQTVTVTESLPLVNTTNAETGGTLENNTLMNVPLNGRNYRWLVAFIPAVTLKPGEGNSSISTNGSGNYPNFMIDGLYNQAIYTKDAGAVGAVSETGDTTLMPLDAVQEVVLIVNPKAEYGWDPGLTMSAILKSGTNDIHGSAYAFGRDQAFDARNAFAPVRAPVDFQQFGATVGGPIKKNKLFYFLGYEGQRLSIASTFTETSPTTADWSGTSGGCPAGFPTSTANCSNSIPDAIAAINYLKANPPSPALTGTVAVNPLSANLVGCDPTNTDINSQIPSVVALACSHNQFGAASLFNNFNSSSTTVTNTFPNDGGSDNGLAKLDYHISDKHTLNGSFYYGEFAEYGAANSTVFTQPYWEELQRVQSLLVRVGEVWTPNSAMLNEARFGYDYSSRPTARGECAGNGDTGNPLGFGGSTGALGGPNYVTQYGLVSGAPACGIPTITITGFTGQLGFANDREELDHDTQGADSFSYTRGNHQFKFGTDIRAEYFMGNKVQDQETGEIGFGASGIAAFGNASQSATALESFLAGVPSSESIRFGNPVRTITTTQMAFFAQDDWRIHPKLTLNLGLRWEGYTPGRDANGLLGNFNPATPTGLVQPNQIWPFESTWDPHFGLAWDIFGAGKTVLRSGIGFAHAMPTLQEFISSPGNDLGSEPTGALLYQVAGTTEQGPGTMDSALTTRAPVTSGGVAVSNLIPWTQGAALFTPSTLTCGNGLGQVNPLGAISGTNPANPAPCRGTGDSANLTFPQYIGWNLNIQHAFTQNLSIDVGYVGSHTSDEAGTLDLNQPLPGVAGATNELLRRPYQANCAGPSPYEGLNPNECFPWFSTILSEVNIGSVNYNGLQINLTERATHGLVFSLNYTLSHALGIQPGNGLGSSMVENSLDPKADYGSMALDARNHFTMTASYAVPGKKIPGQLLEGWALNTSLDFLSALPINAVDTSFDTSGTGEKLDRWDLYGPASNISDILGKAGTIPCYGLTSSKLVTASGSPCIKVAAGTGTQGTPGFVANFPAACVAAAEADSSSNGGLWNVSNNTSVPNTTAGYNGLSQLANIGCYEVNGSVIVPPAQGTWGTMTYDELRGAGFRNWNLSATKDWKFKERYTVQFRAEAFNVLNRTQYGAIGTNLGGPSTFGKSTSTPDVAQGAPITGTGGPRAMQLGLKILF